MVYFGWREFSNVQYTREAAINGAVVAGGFLAATTLVTGLLPTPVFDRYVPRSPADVLFALSTALLLGVYTTQTCTRIDCSSSLAAYASGLGGYFAVACPYCLPVIEATVSVQSIAAYLVPVRPVVGVASVGVLAGVIAVRQRRLVTEGPAVPDVELRCPTCGALLKRVESKPDPEFTGGRGRMDVTCPGCDAALVVFIEAVPGEVVDVRKRVEHAPEDGDGPPTPYSLSPAEGFEK